VCSVTRPGAVITLEAMKYELDLIRNRAKDEKICWLGDVTNVSSVNKEIRDYAADETPKFVKALALITASQLSKLAANIFFHLKKPPYPTRLFTNEQDARAWLRQYM
jgi:hypothetical protein